MGHKTTLLVRGGGDLASGVIHRLYKCGYQVLVLECRKPSAIRRKVSFGETIGSIRMKRRVPYERNQQFHADGTIGFNK